MKKQNIAVIALCFMVGAAFAQNDRDAFRYAQYSPTGTARYSALAGSMGAFGSDFSTLSAGNPAGIGLFKRFEFTFTPALSYNKISSVYNGEEQDGTKYKFAVNNLGIVCVLPPPANTKWKKLHFATGLNNLARYSGVSIASGQNDGSKDESVTSIFDYLAAISEGTDFYKSAYYINYNKVVDNSLDYFAFKAWEDSLIDNVSGEKTRYHSLVSDHFNQQQIRESNGYLNEYIFSFGGNYDDKLFIGGTLGIPFFKYSQNTTYTESSNAFYDTVIFTEKISSNATGVNLKLGIIYQPVKYIRLGAAFHTPTIFPDVEERSGNTFQVWDIPLDSNYEDIISPVWNEELISHYQLITPYHAMASVAFIYKNIGFINVDYEYVDYATSEMQSNTRSYVAENREIKAYYTGTHTIRAGGELNLLPLVLRLGYAYSTNPYLKELEKDGSRHTISGGIGFKGKTCFADFAYIHRFTKDKDVFYNDFSVNPYTSQITNHCFALTLGCKIGK